MSAQLNNGKIDTNVCQSINAGMIILYNKIKDELENKYGIAPDENQIRSHNGNRY